METAQVRDDPRLLELMLQDLDAAPEEYRPTNFWEYYERRFLPWLRSHGLRDFRRQPARGPTHCLTAIGATDLLPPVADVRRPDEARLLRNRYTRRIPYWDVVLRQFSRSVDRALRPKDPRPMQLLSWEYARAYGREAGARALEELSLCMAGNPEDAFAVDAKWYTRSGLFYYMQYAYAARHHSLGGQQIVVELGSGGGKQAEILRLAHPDLCLFLFDLPPQLYVAHQFLSTAFPNDVLPYQESRETSSLSALAAPGRIILAGSWRFPEILSVRPDLFWNAASFQEMEPPVVANYLGMVNEVARAAYLHQKMEGQEIAKRPGLTGVLEPTTLAHYRVALSNFELVDLSPTPLPSARELALHSNSYWQRRIT